MRPPQDGAKLDAMPDVDPLQRFVDAQRGVFGQVEIELKAGRKHGHWMWFVFPQMTGLGHSAMAQKYGIASLAEAGAYLAHPLLGPRLREATRWVVDLDTASIGVVFGPPDDLKFHSSMTLFARAAADNQIFEHALRRYFGSAYDPSTLELLGR